MKSLQTEVRIYVYTRYESIDFQKRNGDEEGLNTIFWCVKTLPWLNPSSRTLRIVNALARCGFSGMDQITETRCHVFDGINQHHNI